MNPRSIDAALGFWLIPNLSHQGEDRGAHKELKKKLKETHSSP